MSDRNSKWETMLSRVNVLQNLENRTAPIKDSDAGDGKRLTCREKFASGKVEKWKSGKMSKKFPEDGWQMVDFGKL